MIKHTIVAALLLTGCASAGAAEGASVVIHGLSKHATARNERTGQRWQEVNAGLGIRYAFDRELSVQAGVYRNSEGNTSAYAIADWTPLHVLGADVGGSLGAVTGYDMAPVLPAPTLLARWQHERTAITVRYLPPLHPKVVSVVAVEFGIAF